MTGGSRAADRAEGGRGAADAPVDGALLPMLGMEDDAEDGSLLGPDMLPGEKTSPSLGSGASGTHPEPDLPAGETGEDADAAAPPISSGCDPAGSATAMRGGADSAWWGGPPFSPQAAGRDPASVFRVSSSSFSSRTMRSWPKAGAVAPTYTAGGAVDRTSAAGSSMTPSGPMATPPRRGGVSAAAESTTAGNTDAADIGDTPVVEATSAVAVAAVVAAASR